ncbi:hypothetical protein QBC34DRAFT_474767 [Podospora aff. communis PSN243]|uniref:Uncharacterized protein n=1 Tax=Podospora aff. communis PSN243 TaxID=3040156 RepID=A0AAV9GAD4_9PEZI|nr:hypothetical protein QBC34DRAFT_474767 [Podospora aff. communis PSN243]
MTETTPKHTRSPYAIILTSISVLLLSALVITSALLTTHTVLLNKDPSPVPGWRTISSPSPTTWNVGITVLGTAVGIIASAAFAAQDAFLTRAELVSESGVAGIFLRPLGVKRCVQQVVKGRFTVRRTGLLFSFLATSLVAAATVGLLGAGVREVVVRVGGDGVGGSLEGAEELGGRLEGDLMGFMWKSASVNGRGKVLGREVVGEDVASIGGGRYRGLWTAGVGVNVSGYPSWSGGADGFNPPREFTFNRLEGNVPGTVITAECGYKTPEYLLQALVTEAGPSLTTVSKPGRGGSNITLLSNSGPRSPNVSSLVIASNLTFTDEDPIHILVVAGASNAESSVFECTYAGREVITHISMAGPYEPLSVGPVISNGSLLNPAAKRLVAVTLHRQIGSWGGGALASGLRDSLYMKDGETNSRTEEVLGMVLSQSAEAVMSAVRQTAGVANPEGAVGTDGVYVDVEISVLRVGGGGRGWFAVYGLLLLASLTALGRVCNGAPAVAFEAQETATLLAKVLEDESLTETTQLRFLGGKGLVWSKKGGSAAGKNGIVSEDR